MTVGINRQGPANSAVDVFWNVNDEPSSIQFTKSIRLWCTVNVCCKSELLSSSSSFLIADD